MDWSGFFRKVFQEFSEDKIGRLAASLSYYTVFSIAPLLVIVVLVAGLVLGADVVQQQVVNQLESLVGTEGAQLVNTLLTNARHPGSGLLTTAIAIGAILLGATGVVGELKDALNTIWDVAPKPGSGLFRTFFERLLSLGMVLGLGFLLLVSLIASTALSALGGWLGGYMSQWVILAQLADIVISFGGITLLFALLFKYLPDVRVAWRDVWIGAAVTALLFTIGKYLIGLYLNNSNVASPFGAAGSLVILFIWVYYAAQILFVGAEITQVYSNQYGSGIRPAEDAVHLTDAARVEQGTRTPSKDKEPDTAPTAPASGQTASFDIRAYENVDGDAFNPLRLVGAAIGVPLFGALGRLMKYLNPNSREPHQT